MADDSNTPDFSPDQINSAMAAVDSPTTGTEQTAAPQSQGPAPISAIEKPTEYKAPEFTTGDISEAYEQSVISDNMALRSTLMRASDDNPDQAAKALPIATKMDLPLGTVQRNYDMLSKPERFTMDYVSNLQKQYPKTAGWFKDPNNAAIGHDDVDSLSQIEGSSLAATMIDRTALATYDEYQAGKYMLGALTKNQAAMDAARGDLTFSKQLSSEMEPDFSDHPIGGFLYRAAQGTMDFAPAMGAAIVNPLLGVAAFGAGGFTGESGEIIARGGSTKQALGGGAISGTINALAGPIFGTLGGAALKNSPLPQWAADTVAHGVVPMTVMGVGNATVDTAIANPDKTWGDYLRELPGTIGESAMQGLLFHVGGLGYAKAKDATMSRFSTKYAAAKAAEQMASVLKNVNDVAANSKLRERSPDSFNSFMQSATEDTPIHTLWVEQEALKESGITPEKLAQALPNSAEDIADAALNGYAVKLSAADFATKLAGTPEGEALVPHLKTDPNGMSARESEAFMKNGGADEFIDEMTKAAEADQGTEEFDKSAKAVESQIAARYAATGRFPKDVNATVAKLGAFYRVLATEYGISPEEAYKRHGAGVSGADMRAAGPALDGSQPEPKAAPAKAAQDPAIAAQKAEGIDQDNAQIDSGLRAIRNAPRGTERPTARNPVLQWIKKRGGIDPASAEAKELRRMDVDTKTVPGLFAKPRRSSALKDNVGGVKFDNIPVSEFPEDMGAKGENGYVDRDWLMNQIDNELRSGRMAGPEDQNAHDLAAELAQRKIDHNNLTDEQVKKKLTAARIKDVQDEAKKLGFLDISKDSALFIDRLRREGYDISDAIDSVMEREAIQNINEIGTAYDYPETDIPFDFPSFPETSGTDREAEDGANQEGGVNAEDSNAGREEDSAEAHSGSEDNSGALFNAPEDSARDIAARNADKRLKGQVPQKGLNDLDLFDENGRIIDSQDELFQRDNEPANGLYSALSKAASGLKQVKGDGEQMLATLRKMPGIKEEEIAWTGLDDFLKGKKSVTRQEIMDYLDANQVQIEEVTLGQPNNDKFHIIEENGEFVAYDDQGRVMGAGATRVDAYDQASETASMPEQPTKFSQYTLPGGDNYREVLLTLPPKESDVPVRETDGWKVIDNTRDGDGFRNLVVRDQNNETVAFFHTFSGSDEQAIAKAAQNEANGAKRKLEKENFSSNHFEQKNILAHMRLDDRTDADGKRVLFVEEIQSDWHQAGRKKGYKDSNAESRAVEKRKAEIQARINSYKPELVVISHDGDIWSSEFIDGTPIATISQDRRPDIKTEDQAREAMANVIKSEVDRQVRNAEMQLRVIDEKGVEAPGVPDAPFKKSWHEMAFRRVAQMAAQQGYDRVAWTTGDQQNERFDLSNQVDRIGYTQRKDGYYNFSAEKDGNVIFTDEKVGIDRIEDVLGKDMAEKIKSGEGKEYNNHYGTITRELTGLDLKVGGEGMKGFYDKIIPTYAKKFAKKFGGDVGTTKIGTETITDEDRDLVAQLRDEEPPESRGDVQVKQTVHSMDITPEMRKTANDTGFELFQADRINGGNNASYNPTTQEIWLGKKANLTSMLHEEGHHFLNIYTKMAALADAPQRIRDIADAALKSLGVEGATPEERIANWSKMSLDEQRAGHERWARNFERYLFRGKAPSIELQPAFDAFRGWLKKVYGSIRDFVAKNPEAGSINEEIRGVMDRMLATDEEIDYARRVRNFGSLFRSPEEAGMTADEYKAYQALGAQSIEDATNELQARSLRDMALTRRLHDKSVRALKVDARAKRKSVEDEVTQDVMQEPVNQARTFLKRGEVDGKPVGGVHKLDIDALKRMYGDTPDAVWQKLQSKFGRHGIIGKGGVHPDDIAPQFGFKTGDEMIRAMVDQPSVSERIQNLTDQRMVERYGDLTDPLTIARRADQAVHNEARIRFVADELNAARKAVGKQKIMKDAAKEYARSLIGRQKAGDIKPELYAKAAAKSALVAEKAMKKGNMAEVAEAKRNQLVNEYATKLAYEALDTVRKIRDNAKRYEKDTVRKRIGTDIEQIDALLDQYNMRLSAVERVNKRQQSLQQWYDSQIEADYEPMIDDKILQSQEKIHYADLSFQDLKSLDVALRTIEQTAKARKELFIEGKKVALNTAVSEMVERMQERKEKFTTKELLNRPRPGVDSVFKVGLDRFQSALRAGGGILNPQDFRANKYDLHEIGGPFHKYLFDPIFDRNYWKGEQLNQISKTFEDKVKELGKDWQDSLYDKVTNNTLIDKAASSDGNPVYRELTRGDLIGIARHMGNESNFQKLVSGMEWDPVEVWRFLDENMRASDWKAVQAEWDSFEKHWPEIEAMVRRLGGEVPEKIPVRPFKTRHGEMSGGYAPIEYDPMRSRLAHRLGDVKADSTQSLGKNEYYKSTTTVNKSLQGRKEGYSDIVNLDYHYMTRRLHETIHDLAYREVILNAKKILEHPEFRDQFQRTFGREEYNNLQNFITHVRDMYTRDGKMDAFEKAIQYSRQGIVMNGIGYRLTTVIKHGSSAGLKSLGFVEGPGRKYLLARAARMATGNAKTDIEEARNKFPEINARLRRIDRDFSTGEHSLYDKEGWKEKNNRFGHAMVAWSDALTAIPTAHAAYDWAITEGVPKKFGGTGKPMSPEDAVKFANSVVRQAHGSALESARSNFLHLKGMSSLLGMIYQFQNNTFGQIGDVLDKFSAANSRYTDTPALAGRLAAAMVAPAIVGYLVSNGYTKEPWWKQLTMAITGELASTVPLLRDGWGMVEAMSEGRDWRDSALQLPPIRVAGDVANAFSDAVKEFKGKETHIIQDAANAIGELFHIAGLGQAGKTAQYMRDVHVGKQHPQSAGEYIKAAAIGPKPKEKGVHVVEPKAPPKPKKPKTSPQLRQGGALKD